jgi:hypothetical protein
VAVEETEDINRPLRYKTRKPLEIPEAFFMRSILAVDVETNAHRVEGKVFVSLLYQVLSSCGNAYQTILPSNFEQKCTVELLN